MSEETVSRRGYVKYAAAGIVVVAGAAAGAYYSSKPGIQTSTETSQTPMSVRIGHLVADIHHIGFFVALSKGFYEEEGITPVRQEYGSGPLEMMAFSAGDIDAGYAGGPPVLTSKSKGVDLMMVASANLEGSALVAAIVTSPTIKEVKDLNNRRVGTPGIGTIQDSLLYIVEKEFGITMTRSHMKVSDLPLALEKGEIDAYIAWEPFAAESVVKGLSKVIYTSHEIFPNHQCCVLYVSGKMFREDTSLVKKLIRAHVRAIKFAVEQPEEAMNIFAEMTGKSIDVVKESWKRMVWDYHINVESMKVLVQYLIEQGKVSSADIPDVEQFVTAAVDEKLLAEVEATL